jgi:hypothetical protein
MLWPELLRDTGTTRANPAAIADLNFKVLVSLLQFSEHKQSREARKTNRTLNSSQQEICPQVC